MQHNTFKRNSTVCNGVPARLIYPAEQQMAAQYAVTFKAFEKQGSVRTFIASEKMLGLYETNRSGYARVKNRNGEEV